MLLFMSARAAAVMHALEQSVPEQSDQATTEQVSVASSAGVSALVPTALAYVPHPGSGRIFFEPPGGGADQSIIGFQISADDGDGWSHIQPPVDFASLPQLAFGQRCLVRVRAVTATGPEKASDPIEVTVGQSCVSAVDQATMPGIEVIVLALVPTTRNANAPKVSDGSAAGDELHVCEYSLDGCRSWAATSPGQPLVLTRVNPDEPFALRLRPVR